MAQKKVLLKERLILSYISVVFISLFISILFSYTLFILTVNKRLDPEITGAKETMEGRISELMEKSLIFTDIISREKEALSFLKNELSRDVTIEDLRRFNSKAGLDILQILDQNGKVLLSLENPSVEPYSKINDNLVQKGLRGYKNSSFQIEDGKPSIVSIVPIQENGKTYGALLGGFTVTNQLLNKIEGSLHKKISVFDLNGYLFATTIEDKNGVRVSDQRIDQNTLIKLKEGQKFVRARVNIEDIRYRVLYSMIGNFEGKDSFIIMIALPLETIIADNNRTIGILVFANLITVVIALSFAMKNSKDLIDPIYTIKKGTEIVGSGNLDYKINVSTDDEITDLANSFNDMTKRIKTLLDEVSDEKNIASTERNKFFTVFEGVLDGILTLDYDRRITLFNKAAEEITGLSSKDVLGKKCDEVLLFFKNKVRLPSSEFCTLKEADKDQTIFSDNNLKLVTSKKDLFVSLTSSVIKEGKLANLGCILTFQDTTRERELEEMKLDFVSMAAHELRTPLTSIRGYISLLEPKIKGIINENDMKFLERIDISASQLSTLIENLLDVSKIEHDSLEIEVKKEEWVEIVEASVEGFKDLAKEKEIKLSFKEPKSTIPPVAIDKFRISEVLSNLLANALNFTNEGGEVTVTIGIDNGFIKTIIKDTGCGIPERAIPHLFTKFYRVTGILEKGSKGTGLGLYISKSIVSMHGGKIWVESKLGVGSSFSFTVPIFSMAEATKSSSL